MPFAPALHGQSPWQGLEAEAQSRGALSGDAGGSLWDTVQQPGEGSTLGMRCMCHGQRLEIVGWSNESNYPSVIPPLYPVFSENHSWWLTIPYMQCFGPDIWCVWNRFTQVLFPTVFLKIVDAWQILNSWLTGAPVTYQNPQTLQDVGWRSGETMIWTSNLS